MSHNHMDRCCTSLITRKIQIKTISHPLEWLKRQMISDDEDGEKWEPLYIAREDVKQCRHFRTQSLELPQNGSHGIILR